MIRIPDATENLRASLKRLYNPETAKQCSVDDATLKRFIDGGHLSDEDKEALTFWLFPHLLYEPASDMLVQRPPSFALPNATALLRRLVDKSKEKSDLARAAKINLILLDQFASGQRDLSAGEKNAIAKVLGINREYVNDELISIPAKGAPFINPPDAVARPWREQPRHTMGDA